MNINDILFEFAPSGGGDSGNYFQALASAWYNGTFDTGSLQKGIKSQQDVERLLNRGIVCPDGKTRKLHIDYNSDFDGVEIYSDDYYEYGDHDATIDSRTGQKWGPYDFMEFSDEDLSEGLNEFVTPQAVAQDPGLEREKDVDVIFYGHPGKDYNAEDAWAALEEVLPAEYPPGSEKAQYKVAEVAKSGGAVVTTKPLSVAKQLVSTFNGYGIKSRVNGNLTEFAADDGNSGGEDDALRNYARMWWAGDEATQMQIERALARMGWEIGEDEGGYDNGGVFVVRAGDVNGNSYQSWAAEDLTEGSAQDSKSWMASIRQQHPGVKFVQAKMPGAPIIALVNGKPVAQFDGKQGVAEATGDEKFDTMMGQIQREPKYPDSQMPPTDVKDLYQWAVKNNKPYHKIFAEWANREGFKSVAPALMKAGNLDTDALDYWTPRVWKIYWGEVRGIDSEMPPEWSKKRVPDELRDYLETVFDAYDRIVFDWPTEYRQIGGQGNYAEGDLNEKSTSQAQFRTMAAAAHDPKFAKKVGIKQSVAREFNRADTDQDYKDLPKKADESKQVPAEKEADYGDDYQDMVKRVKKLAGLGPLKTVYDPNKRVYKNMPTAVQPRK